MSKNKMSKMILLLAILVFLGALATIQVKAIPTIVIDKSDYSPGETVTITGSGFVPGVARALS